MSERKHKTKKTIIKQELVDVRIRLVVQWLNSFRDIRTQFSCEGDNASNGQKPHILFHCDCQLDLVKVLSIMGSWATLTVEVFEGSLRYNMVFPNRRNLDCFKDSLEKYYNFHERSR